MLIASILIATINLSIRPTLFPNSQTKISKYPSKYSLIRFPGDLLLFPLPHPEVEVP